MQARNRDNLESLYEAFSKNGCCSEVKPEITRQIRANGKAYYSRKVKTESFALITSINRKEETGSRKHS